MSLCQYQGQVVWPIKKGDSAPVLVTGHTSRAPKRSAWDRRYGGISTKDDVGVER